VPLVTKQEVKDWVVGDGVGSVTGVSDPVLDACIAAAGELIIAETSRIWEKASFTERFNGDSALGKLGELLVLKRFPVTFPADAITVTESGTALTVAQGYSTSAGVIVEDAAVENRCSLIRVSGGARMSWLAGVQNIVVTYSAGFATLPEGCKQAAKELSWLCYTQGRKSGVESVSQAGSSRSLISQLSWPAQQWLKDARRW
jgi:hypothetical protein